MRQRIGYGVVFILLAFSGASQKIMTLGKALQEGLNNNFGILIARNVRQIAGNDASPGNAGFLPVIDLSGAYTYSLTDAKVEVISGQTLDNSQANTNVITGAVTLEWTLFDGCRMFVRKDQLKTLEEMGELETRAAVENTVAAITVAYYNIIRQAEEVHIFGEQVEISEYRLDLAKTRYETGSGSEMESLKAHVEMNADVAALADQETKYKNSKTYLNQILSRDINTLFEVNDSIMLPDTLLLDTVKRNMLLSNKRLLLAGKEMQVSYLEIKNKRASQFPVIDLFGGFSYFRNETEASFINYNRLFGPSVGISATMTLFDGLNLNRERQNAKILYLNKELELQRLTLRLEAYLVRVYNEYLNQIQLVGFEMENLMLAQRNMDIAKESYTLGAISSLQLREIQKNLLDARLRLLTAKFEAKKRETELMLLSGRLAIKNSEIAN